MRCLYLSLLVLVFSACSDDDEDRRIIESSVWELAEVESFNGTITTKEDLIAQEIVELNNDNTFVKTRIRDGVVTHESSGIYEFDYQDDITLLYLDHSADYDYIINCTGALRETFIYEPGVITNNSSACDWPILRFFEVK